jgi:predicted small secreted protein
MTRGLWLAFGLVLLTVIPACNTVEGAGRDISGAANIVRDWFR